MIPNSWCTGNPACGRSTEDQGQGPSVTCCKRRNWGMVLAILCEHFLLHPHGFLLNNVWLYLVILKSNQANSIQFFSLQKVTIFPSHPLHFNANYSDFKLLDCQQRSGWLCTWEGNTCFYHSEGSVFFSVKQIHRQKSYSALLPPYSRFLSPCPFKSLPALRQKPFSPADWNPDTFYKAISVEACAIFKLVCQKLHQQVWK